MNYLQEIYFYANKGVQFTCHIISTNNTAPFSAESLTFDPAINTLFSSLHPIGNQFQTANDAYQEIVNYIVKYSNARNLQVQKIDNPCNAPFINKADQQTIISSSNITATVLVNGK